METDENHRNGTGTCKRSRTGPPEVEEEDGDGLTGRAGLRPWNQQASRIFLVSRASGGKDRHSKVYTSKGLRDRRVRLSVSTAIQFYDLQDRLGYDQPSKAIEWLIKTAAAAISELPTIETSFPLEPPKQQHCSSASETSKGLYLSRSKTRDRAATREKCPDNHGVVNHCLNSQSSFTDLLTGTNGTPIADNPIQKQLRYLPMAATADYFSLEAIFGKTNQNPLFTSIAHNGKGAPMGMVPFTTAALAMGDYSLNYSSCPAGFNRGTLQSNSPPQLSHHQHHHIQRLSYPVDGSKLPLFLGSAPSTAAVANSGETQLSDGFDGRLQLCFSDWHGVSESKDKAKS